MKQENKIKINFVELTIITTKTKGFNLIDFILNISQERCLTCREVFHNFKYLTLNTNIWPNKINYCED